MSRWPHPHYDPGKGSEEQQLDMCHSNLRITNCIARKSVQITGQNCQDATFKLPVLKTYSYPFFFFTTGGTKLFFIVLIWVYYVDKVI